MSWKFFLFAAGACLVITLAAFVTEKGGTSDFESARQVIVMRKIAHDVLRSAGDNTSRILPVEQISKNEFRILFSTSFSFKSDSLVRLINQAIEANQLPSSYIVNVVEQASNKVIFGYAMLGHEHKEIVPCRGREQPDLRYAILISFNNKADGIGMRAVYLAGFGFAGIGMLMFIVQSRKKKDISKKMIHADVSTATTPLISIGKYAFNPEEQVLIFADDVVKLTAKESKLLNIFAHAPNVIIDRDRLQKEGWEDEGVFVGRSLDMFVSKLRKKFIHDPSVKITNIHGKGYKLEISQ